MQNVTETLVLGLVVLGGVGLFLAHLWRRATISLCGYRGHQFRVGRRPSWLPPPPTPINPTEEEVWADEPFTFSGFDFEQLSKVCHEVPDRRMVFCSPEHRRLYLHSLSATCKKCYKKGDYLKVFLDNNDQAIGVELGGGGRVMPLHLDCMQKYQAADGVKELRIRIMRDK